jgi:hypothetical protein
MLVSAAVCPHPPALVPAVSRGSASQLAELRDACTVAVRRLRGAQPDVVVCVGAGEQTTRWGAEAGGTLRDYGVDVRFGGPAADLPLALVIGAYLFEEAGGAGCDIYQAVADSASPQACRELGAELAALAPRVAMLAMGDGSARRTRQSPGPYAPGAEGFDDEVKRALTAPDPEALLAIDPGLARELWAAGRAAWQVLAGAMLGSPAAWITELGQDAAPLGVGYLVVSLKRHDLADAR